MALRDITIDDKPQDSVPASLKPPRLRDLLPTDKESYFRPGPSFVAPRSDLFFGGDRRKYSLLDFLPSRVAADKLLRQYFEAVHTIARIVHRPSFEARYEAFWSDVSKSLEPTPSLQAVVFAALFSAVISMPEHVVLSTYGVPQKDLMENFQLGTETALGKANFLRTTKTETLQALVMYMVRRECTTMFSAHVTNSVAHRSQCVGKKYREPTLPWSEPSSALPNVWASTAIPRSTAIHLWRPMCGG
jgi:hypothetical protein